MFYLGYEIAKVARMLEKLREDHEETGRKLSEIQMVLYPPVAKVSGDYLSGELLSE